jgi:hypothetical protein
MPDLAPNLSYALDGDIDHSCTFDISNSASPSAVIYASPILSFGNHTLALDSGVGTRLSVESMSVNITETGRTTSPGPDHTTAIVAATLGGATVLSLIMLLVIFLAYRKKPRAAILQGNVYPYILPQAFSLTQDFIS